MQEKLNPLQLRMAEKKRKAEEDAAKAVRCAHARHCRPAAGPRHATCCLFVGGVSVIALPHLCSPHPQAKQAALDAKAAKFGGAAKKEDPKKKEEEERKRREEEKAAAEEAAKAAHKIDNRMNDMLRGKPPAPSPRPALRLRSLSPVH